MASSDEDVIIIENKDDVVVIDDEENSDPSSKSEKSPMECPICLQTCIHPAKLPCGHIFCFLCVKGVAYKNRRCAMCRREIPPEFLEHPQLVHGIQDLCKTKTTEDGFQWFYEGRNGGWWEYDSHSAKDIEDAYIKNLNQIDELLLCGSLYTINLRNMTQYPINQETRKRKIKRDIKEQVESWWQYDERTSQDIEDAYKNGDKSCTILVAGYVYVVDFEAMLQQRQNDPSRRRHVKRDLATIPKKGVAGLRIDDESSTSDQTQILASRSQEEEVDVDNDDEGEEQIPNNIAQRQNNNQRSSFISTIVATDAAIRIASDIIGSTLAHADELTNRQQLNSSNTASTSNSSSAINNQQNDNRELLQETEELLEATQEANIASTNDNSSINNCHNVSPADLFAQTLDDFRSLTLRNVIDSSDSEDDNDQIIL